MTKNSLKADRLVANYQFCEAASAPQKSAPHISRPLTASISRYTAPFAPLIVFLISYDSYLSPCQVSDPTEPSSIKEVARFEVHDL